MGLSWSDFWPSCNSPLSAIARSCFLGRLHWSEKYQDAKQTQEELRNAIATSEARCRQLEQENQDLCQRVSELETELAEPRPISLPLGEVPPGQQYGANMMALGVNLARKLGVRRSEHAQKIF